MNNHSSLGWFRRKTLKTNISVTPGKPANHPVNHEKGKLKAGEGVKPIGRLMKYYGCGICHFSRATCQSRE